MKEDIYNMLREFHNELKGISLLPMDNKERNAIDAVDSVLYLAEEQFCKEDN